MRLEIVAPAQHDPMDQDENGRNQEETRGRRKPQTTSKNPYPKIYEFVRLWDYFHKKRFGR
ncbi:hypothetical protein CR194_12885 [Salipaludibacillus keqinensis]|uniref:Uncharacterized protein n=1 Tax=Salipaludibacillus keqinensis TaxID=2045207 RepID=A0A323TBW0_9BACI|nr:hypothetical protein CR194_12885 [Salipaludibacillus keqinensis]